MSDGSNLKKGSLDVKIGDLSFSGSGEQEWLAQQLKTIVEAAPKLVERSRPAAQPEETKGNDGASSSEAFTTSLAAYIREKKAESNQNQRFMAAADWLRRREPNATLSTATVAKALQENQQKRLGNPSDCLNQNVAKGFCEKTKDGFFITPEGRRSLGSP